MLLSACFGFDGGGEALQVAGVACICSFVVFYWLLELDRRSRVVRYRFEACSSRKTVDGKN